MKNQKSSWAAYRPRRSRRNPATALVCALLFALSPSVNAASRVIHADWSSIAKPASGAKFVLIEPDIELSEIEAGGRAQPRADWTRAARRLYPEQVRRMLSEHGAAVVVDYAVPASLPPEARERQLIQLHQAVGISIWQHHFAGLKLPTKGRELDFTLGDGAQVLAAATGADYAVFTYVRDSYTSSGRAAMMVFGALLGVGISGGVQVGFTSLVELRTGRVIWFDFLVDQTGDLRNEVGVQETVRDLFRDFPL